MIPWRLVHNWECALCGRCCINYKVPLLFKEYAHIQPTYGSLAVEPGQDKFFVRRRPDGSCFFLSRRHELFLCMTQADKPHVCRMFPFRVAKTAKFGQEDLSIFFYKSTTFYVYVDLACPGVTRGEPSMSFVVKTLPEFVEIFLGENLKQVFSTGTNLEELPSQVLKDA